MRRGHWSIAWGLIGVSGLLGWPGGGSKRAPPFGLLYELVDEQGRRLPRLEASGIAYATGRLFVVDDTVNSLFVFTPEGRLRRRIDSRHFPRARAKFEDLVFVEDEGCFFVVGSHFGWDEEAFLNQSVLLRFRLNGREPFSIDESTVRTLPLYRSFQRLGLWRPQTMNIEGLAYEPKEDQLLVGLRYPSDRAHVYRVSLKGLESVSEEPPLPEEVLSFATGSLEGTPFCISGMTRLDDPAGLLIVTSTEDERHRFLGNRLWFAAERGEVGLVLDTFDAGMKAEGLAVGGGKLFISYDNDQDDTGIPSRLRVLPLSSLFP